MKRKYILLICFLLAALYFFIFSFPNRAASENLYMVFIFEPDESVPLSYALDMIKPADTFKQALINFLDYNYYWYGYPHFAVSAAALLPLKWMGKLDEMPLVMLTLRQTVSVLPILAAVLLLVFLQTEFKSYKAILLLLFLLSLPAVVHNNFWWHPDGLAVLSVVLTIFFLTRDRLRLGVNFFLAAAMCGIAIGVKGTGYFFVLTIFVYLLMAWLGKKAALWRVILAALGYVLVMFAAYVLSNPLLIYPGARQSYLNVARQQFDFLRRGYEVAYPVGIAEAWPQARPYYGYALTLLVLLGANLWGIWKGPNRLLSVILLTWAIPLTIMAFFVIHFKFQYWLPAMLPFFSNAVLLLPDKPALPSWNVLRRPPAPLLWIQAAALALLFVQTVSFLWQDARAYQARLHEAENSPSIQFYGRAVSVLSPLIPGDYYAYNDVRLYFPPPEGWTTEAIFELLDYDFIHRRNYHVLLLLQQRIDDYLNPEAEGLDPEAFARARQFYQDANSGSLDGYRLLYRDDFGLIYVREDVFDENFAPSP